MTDAALVLTYADLTAGTRTVEASAFVQGVVESGGTCTLSASRGGGTPVTGDATPAEPGPSTTDCGALALDLPAGATGTWKVTARYTSASVTLTSNAMEVEVR